MKVKILVTTFTSPITLKLNFEEDLSTPWLVEFCQWHVNTGNLAFGPTITLHITGHFSHNPYCWISSKLIRIKSSHNAVSTSHLPFNSMYIPDHDVKTNEIPLHHPTDTDSTMLFLLNKLLYICYLYLL